MRTTQKTVFFDIDGTLLYAKGCGRSAFANAFDDVFDMKIDISHINFAGATDKGVIIQLLKEHDVSASEKSIKIFFERLAVHLEKNLHLFPPKLYPNVEHALKEVTLDWNVALITGNTYKCAHLKLKHAGISHFFSDIGGYGDDNSCRKEIAKLALIRAGKPSYGILFGDTPNDILAAKANNLVSVALCTGTFNKNQLMDYNPDHILESFKDIEELRTVLKV